MATLLDQPPADWSASTLTRARRLQVALSETVASVSTFERGSSLSLGLHPDNLELLRRAFPYQAPTGCRAGMLRVRRLRVFVHPAPMPDDILHLMRGARQQWVWLPPLYLSPERAEVSAALRRDQVPQGTAHLMAQRL